MGIHEKVGEAFGRQQLLMNGGKRRRLLEEVLQERQRLLGEAPGAQMQGPDPLDAAREQEEEMVWLAAMDLNRSVQFQVDEASQRLATGQYGVCVECDGPIPEGRLRALPFALRCLPCQERFEAGTWKEGSRMARARALRVAG